VSVVPLQFNAKRICLQSFQVGLPAR